MKTEEEIEDIYSRLKIYRDKVDGHERSKVNHYIGFINYIMDRARKDNSLLRILDN